MITASPCVFCKHYELRSAVEGEPACAAYPDGIPEEIYEVRKSHLVSQPGDHGIQFEARPGFEPMGEMFARID